MKIATYNVWYENIHRREEQLIREINSLDADIIALQEVPPDFYQRLTGTGGYAQHAYLPHDAEMGLAFLSRHPIREVFSLFDSAEYSGSIAHNTIIEAGGIRFSVTNVHLPWDSALEKEKQIVAIDRFIHSQKDKAHFFILLGDFNSTLASSVHAYLLGDQTLSGCEAKPYWNDLAYAHAMLNGHSAAPTLDFVNNPRWRGKNTHYVPDTCDRIYIMESFNWDYAFELRGVHIFGRDVSEKTGYAPSDHYGVQAEVDFMV